MICYIMDTVFTFLLAYKCGESSFVHILCEDAKADKNIADL